jgi:hypothetical protein
MTGHAFKAHALAVALLATAALFAPALADCRDDLIKADQNFAKSRADLHKAASAAPAVKCTAYRRHIASLTEVRSVFARCDTSANKTRNAAQTNVALASFNKQMRETCPAPTRQPKKS